VLSLSRFCPPRPWRELEAAGVHGAGITSAERIATANSAASAEIHPAGPA